MALHKVNEGWTVPIPFVLDGDGGPLDLTGMTIELLMTDRTDAPVTVQGTVTPDPDQVANKGRVTYSPHADDLLPGATDKVVSLAVSDAAGSISYFERKGRFKVTDGAGKVVYNPSGEPDIWRIYKP